MGGEIPKSFGQGDWWDASQIYRDWVLNSAVWTRAGNLSTRARDPGYPHWLLRTPLWTQGDAPLNSSTGFT